MVYSSFVFLNGTSTATTSNNLGIGNNSLLSLEVSPVAEGGNVNVTIQGRLDVDAENWTTLAVVNAATLKVVTSITATGNYFVPVSGYASVRAVSNGTAGDTNVLGRLCV